MTHHPNPQPQQSANYHPHYQRQVPSHQKHRPCQSQKPHHATKVDINHLEQTGGVNGTKETGGADRQEDPGGAKTQNHLHPDDQVYDLYQQSCTTPTTIRDSTGKKQNAKRETEIEVLFDDSRTCHVYRNSTATHSHSGTLAQTGKENTAQKSPTYGTPTKTFRHTISHQERNTTYTKTHHVNSHHDDLNSHHDPKLTKTSATHHEAE